MTMRPQPDTTPAARLAGVLLTLAASLLLGGALTEVLWNGVMPEVWGLPRLTFGPALCLYGLCDVLFKRGRDR